jgi:hypothetical protein
MRGAIAYNELAEVEPAFMQTHGLGLVEVNPGEFRFAQKVELKQGLQFASDMAGATEAQLKAGAQLQSMLEYDVLGYPSTSRFNTDFQWGFETTGPNAGQLAVVDPINLKQEQLQKVLQNGQKVFSKTIVPETGTTSVVGGQPLTAAQRAELPAILSAAEQAWQTPLGRYLNLNVSLTFQDLPGTILGEATITALGPDGLPTAGTIALSPTAAGVGWYVDPTPLDNSAFSEPLDSTAFQASAGSPAAGKYDLYTVLLHEVGHLVGFDPDVTNFEAHIGRAPDGSQVFAARGFTAILNSGAAAELDSLTYPHDVMSDTLNPSVRELPTALDARIIDTVRGVSPAQPGQPAAAANVPGPGSATALPLMGSQQGSADSSLGLVNANFQITDPSDPNFGWTVRGAGSVLDGQALLNEGSQVFTGFSQTFVVPAGVKQLQFTLTGMHFGANGPNPPDAFEAALLDAVTSKPLVGPAAGLSNTDAFFHMQQTGQVFLGPNVQVAGVATSGQMMSMASAETVSVDLSGVKAGTRATLYFDLLGFGPATSSVAIQMGAGGNSNGGGSTGSGGNGSGENGGNGSGNGNGTTGGNGSGNGSGTQSGNGSGNNGGVNNNTPGTGNTGPGSSTPQGETPSGAANPGGGLAGIGPGATVAIEQLLEGLTALAGGSEATLLGPAAQTEFSFLPTGTSPSEATGTPGAANSGVAGQPVPGQPGGAQQGNRNGNSDSPQGGEETDSFWPWLEKTGPASSGQQQREDGFWPWLRDRQEQPAGAAQPSKSDEPIPAPAPKPDAAPAEPADAGIVPAEPADGVAPRQGAIEAVFASEGVDVLEVQRSVRPRRRAGRLTENLHWAWAGLLALLHGAPPPERDKNKRRPQLG